MSKFVLTAQLQLQAPTNVGQVVNQIQSQLNNVKVNVQAQGTAQATRQVQQVTKATQQASNAAAQLGKNFGLSIKRFAAFTIATRAVSLFTSTLSKAIEEAIAFERELIKISQVTGKSISQLRDLTNEITRLSTTLGVSSTSLLSTSRILSQAGLSADETRIALDALAKSQLAPTFDDIGQTAEGVVAIFNQFQQGAEALEAQLGAINAVAGRFAVEAGDLISVVRRTGGVFRAAGGELNELIALFTSVRSTTRESAESIATGLRTIFTRIQRPKTIEFLRQYGVELLDLEGKFVGPFEATRRLSEALAGLEQGDISFVRIAEELGGFRQIGKVIPLLQQFRVAQEALNVAQAGSGSLADDAAKAQAALAVRITKVKEEFLALVRGISESTTFQIFANTALNLASALIKLADALKPVLPLLTAFAAIKLATGFGSFVRGIGGGLKAPKAFATGGLVPGSGNRDTVPAMLTPGEFVIRKSSVAKLGAGNLAAMNENRYAAGGVVHRKRSLYGPKPDFRTIQSKYPSLGLTDNQARQVANGTKTISYYEKQKTGTKTKKLKQSDSSLKRKYPGGLFRTIPGAIGGFFLTPEKGTDNPYTLSSPYPFDLNGQKAAIAPNSIISNFVPFRQDLKKNSILNNMVDVAAKRGIINATKEASVKVNDFLDIKPILNFNDKPVRNAAAKLAKDKQVYSTLGGYLFEGVIQGITGASLAGGRGSFDFPNVINAKAKLAAMFGASEASLGPLLKADAKRSLNSNNNMSIVDKLRQDIQKGNTEGVQRLTMGGLIQKFANGGEVASPKQVAFIESLLSQFQKTVGARHPASDQWMPPDSKLQASSIITQLKATIPELPLIKQFFGKGINYGYRPQGSGFVVTKLPVMGRVQQRPLSQFGGNIEQIQEYIKRGELAFGGNAPNARGPSANSATSRLRTRRGYRGRYALGGLIKEFASGGNVGTDTVPALLTPGEFVINRASAQKIGYGSLNRMNKVGKYAKGGPVGSVPKVQKFSFGSMVNPAAYSRPTQQLPPANSTTSPKYNLSGMGGTLGAQANKTAKSLNNLSNQTNQASNSTSKSSTSTEKNNKSMLGLGGGLTLATGTLQAMLPPLQENSSATERVTHQLLGMVTAVSAAIAAVEAFGLQLNMQNVMSLFSSKGSLTTRLSTNVGKTAARGYGRLIPGATAKGALGFGKYIAGATSKLIPFAATLGTVVLVGKGLQSLVRNIMDYDRRLKKAIESGDVAEARKVAGESVAFNNASNKAIGTTAGAAAGFMLGGPIGAAIGAAIGYGITSAFSESVEAAQAAAAAQAELVNSQKSLKETTEKAAEAMKEFEAGNISAAEAVKAAAASSEQIYKSRLAVEEANRLNTEQRGTSGWRDVLAYSGGGLFGMETNATRNARIEQENKARTDEQKKLEEEQFKTSQPALNAFARQVAATGGGLEEYLDGLKALGFKDSFIRQNEKKLTDAFNNIAKEAERTKKAFEAMNLGFQNINGVAGAMSVGLSNLMASQEAGYSTLDNSIAILEASVTNAAQGISDEAFGSALSEAAAGLRQLGASNEQITKFAQNLSAINTAQKFFAKASKEAKQKLIDEFQRGATGQSNATNKREAFADAVVGTLDGVPDEVKNRIKDALENADIGETELNEILSGNMAALDAVLEKLGTVTLEQVEALKELSKYNKALTEITKKRLELENRVISAQRNLLEAQMEAADIIAKYGGPAVTPEMRRQNILDQANLQASGTGVGALRTGSAAELNTRSAQARARLAEIGQLRADAQRQGPVGDAARQRLGNEEGAKLAAEEQRLQELAKSDYETTKKLISLKEEEIKLIQEKNRLEKSSIEALITGDIAKFFEQQAAVGATAAIALGNDSLQNAFGPQALGQAALDIQRQQQAGVQSLYGQQLGGAGGLVERGFGAAISARGVGGAGALSMAQMAAGTTAEEEAARGEIRSLAATLPNYAETQLQVAQQDKTTADIQYQAAQMQLQAAKETARARGVDVAGMARGGVVYANNGIFVPKGTDTVPAMLTPGEFVVRREAVRRGNNLQLLQSMNRGQSGVSTNGAVAMADGGVVYARRGIFVNRNSGVQQTNQTGIGLSPDLVNKLATSLNSFNSTLSANIDRLNNTSFNVKLDTTNVNVNLNGGSFLSKLKDDLKNELLVEIGNQIKNYSVGQDGRLKSNPGTLT